MCHHTENTNEAKEIVCVRARIVKVGDCKRELALEIEQPGCNAKVIVDRKNVFRMKTKKELVQYEAGE